MDKSRKGRSLIVTNRHSAVLASQQWPETSVVLTPLQPVLAACLLELLSG
jgi:hypothetical protein